MRFLKKYYKYLIVSSTVFAICLIADLVNSIINFIPQFAIKFGLILLTLISFAISIFLLTFIVNRRSAYTAISRQNDYNFGEKSGFFDLQTFMNITEKARKSHTKKDLAKYITVFTASNEAIVANLKRNQSITELNKEISKRLARNLLANKKVSARNYFFGFARGMFYLCSFGENEEQLRETISSIAKWIYEIQDEKAFKFFVQPMFGVAEFLEEENISEAIDNAIIARNLSEKNFEQVTVYRESFKKNVDSDLAKDIELGLANNEFIVYYQPKFSLVERKFTSSEALVRWDSEKHGMLSPSRFIPIAESAGLIHQIDTFVFKRVLEDISNTIRRGHRVMPVSVNFSLFEFFSTKFLDNILAMLDEYKVDSNLIQIEITETTSQTNQFLSTTIIKKLQEKGIKILMDDFGVGFSNIGNLRKIPFDCIKIDKSYIDTIDTDPKSAEIVKFLIQLCKINGMEVVAEGVDNAKQVELLKKFKCDVIQGWYYSKALSYKDFEAFLIKNPFERKEKEAKE